MSDLSFSTGEHVSLVDVLDRVLKKGAVISGDITIAVADIDLITLNLQVLLAAVEALTAASGPDGSEDPAAPREDRP